MVQFPRVTKEAQSAAFRTMIWTPLTEMLPTVGRQVLVKMQDESIEGGSWDTTLWHWRHALVGSLGDPVAWAPLPLLGGTA